MQTYLLKNRHNIAYEHEIRSPPNKWCVSCNRFLFPDQVHQLSRIPVNVDHAPNLSRSSNLCTTCFNSFSTGKTPSICVAHNELYVEDPPTQLTKLNKIERRLLSLIQVFFTFIILPGGQYAEKGLMLNLPVDISAVTSQLPSLLQHNTCAVTFEAGNPTTTSVQHMINPQNVWDALQWLHAHNHLYHNVNISQMSHIPLNDSNISTDDMVDNIDSTEENSYIPLDYPAPEITSIQDNHAPTMSIPRSTSSPVSIYEKPFGEESAFPWLFPNSLRLYDKRGIWRKDIMYLLHDAASYDILQLKSEIGVYLKMNCGSQIGLNNNPITTDYIRHCSHDPLFLQNTYMFMKNICGMVAYFRNGLNNLLAMLKYIGPPTLFVTVSANDLHWPELGMVLDNITYQDATSRSNLLDSMRSHPLLTAIHFDRRFKALFKHVINGPDHPLGKVVGIPQKINEDSIPILLGYINKVIHTNIPDNATDPELHQLVKSLQSHHHTKYCMPHPLAKCRFKFPRPVRTHFQAKISFIEEVHFMNFVAIQNLNTSIHTAPQFSDISDPTWTYS